MKVTQLRGHTSYIDDQPSSAAIPNLKNAGFLANFHDQIAIANRMQHKHVTIGVIQNTGLAVYRDYLLFIETMCIHRIVQSIVFGANEAIVTQYTAKTIDPITGGSAFENRTPAHVGSVLASAAPKIHLATEHDELDL